jgi:dipeptidase
MSRTHVLLMCALFLLGTHSGEACTNLLVTRGASVDGSVMITYTCDGCFHPHLSRTPAAEYPPGDSLAITRWGGEVKGWIDQVEHTYAVVNLINEHQLAISETTFDGRPELRNRDGMLHYWDLMQLALQRARTAREAIDVMTGLVARYGYGSTGESISIADTKEAWILEIIGPGPDSVNQGRVTDGALWVAVRVPDGYISAHANKARIGTFPLDDPDNCRYSRHVIEFAIEQGYYDPDSGEPFRFNEAYCPSNPRNQRYASARVWSIFRRAAPSLELSPDYHRAVEGAEPYPLWIKPDGKLSLQDVFDLMRDHYEGTAYDMTQGVDAGPYGCPNRWRPMTWEVDSVAYAWERPISTQQTGFSFVSQSRGWLPDEVGGVIWYGVDDTYTTCYVPLYCSIEGLPEAFTVGNYRAFSWESAFWVFNVVANFACLKFQYMYPEIRAVQEALEGQFIRLQPAVDRTAVALLKSDPELMRAYVTDYSVSAGEKVVRRWRELAEYLFAKYNDGYVAEEPGRPKDVGYPEQWLRTVLQTRAADLRLPVVDTAADAGRLVD